MHCLFVALGRAIHNDENKLLAPPERRWHQEGTARRIFEGAQGVPEATVADDSGCAGELHAMPAKIPSKCNNAFRLLWPSGCVLSIDVAMNCSESLFMKGEILMTSYPLFQQTLLMQVNRY